MKKLKLNNLVKELKKGFKEVFFSEIIMVLTIIILIIYAIIILSIWGFNLRFYLRFTEIPGDMFIFYLKIFGVLILFLYALTKWCRITPHKENWGYKIINHLNGYFFLFLFLTLVISSFGVSVIYSVYSPSLPREFNILDSRPYLNESLKLSRLECDNNHHEFVVGDDLKCNLNIVYAQNPRYLLKNLTLNYKHELDNEDTYQEIRLSPINTSTFGIPLIGEGVSKSKLYYNLYSTDGLSTMRIPQDITLDVISLKSYQDSRSKLYAYIFSIFTVSLFSIAVFVKTLKELMEPKT